MWGAPQCSCGILRLPQHRSNREPCLVPREKKYPPCPSCPPSCTAACPDGWVGYRGKCFFFSETKESWNLSQSHCSSLGASLGVIDSPAELTFMQRYVGPLHYWIGLHRETNQAWRWTSGNIFNDLFKIMGEGHCAYINKNNVSSARCSSERHFICSWPDNCAGRKI